MKKLLVILAVVAFVGVMAVPAHSFVTNNPTIVLDDPPKTKEVKTTDKDEKKATAETKEAKKKSGDCSDKMATKSCCSKDKKK